MQEPWDYLILTASNELQAKAFEGQLAIRKRLGLLADIRNTLVVSDPGGKRIGSGGSTILCLMTILQRHIGQSLDANSPETRLRALGSMRILIIHAGGDSKRLPAYGPCGKVFVPVPGQSDSAIPPTMFDLQLPTYLSLPMTAGNNGQVVITSGDVLLKFDPATVRFAASGLTGLGCHASPQQASRHGVFCSDDSGPVRKFLQKPTPDEQAAAGAVDHYGQSLLDIGVMSFDAAFAVALLQLAKVRACANGTFTWGGPIGDAILSHGLDFYREICCAMGSETAREHYLSSCRNSGSKLGKNILGEIFAALSRTGFHVQVLPRCEFLDFGATQQIIPSGMSQLQSEQGISRLDIPLAINNDIAAPGGITGSNAWVEGCRIHAPLILAGDNILAGLDIDQPLAMPRQACLDVLAGADRSAACVWFVRCYGINDQFKETAAGGATFCGSPIRDWLCAVGADESAAWTADLAPDQRSLWNARLFPSETSPKGFRNWLWMFNPEGASPAQKSQWLSADRYSFSEIVRLADLEAFHSRRFALRAKEIRRSLRRMFRPQSNLSADDLAFALQHSHDPAGMAADLLAEAQYYCDSQPTGSLVSFTFSRIIHTLASALETFADDPAARAWTSTVALRLAEPVSKWLESLALAMGEDLSDWIARAQEAAFAHIGRVIVSSVDLANPPRNALRSDQIVWARAPARLDLGGGWTDTPPYSLENGGCVINAAVNLNGQPPIHAYARVVEQPIIRISSIDMGTKVDITTFDELLDYRTATSEFALAKAALAMSGFSPLSAAWPEGISLREMLERFGGGIELTTLSAIPKGSGLGTSSIVGAVILAAIQRMIGKQLTPQELFHGVLRLEQELTTGGGWQDQIGGAVGEVKIITAAPGLIPDAQVRYVPPEMLDPRSNGGCTMLYYTGITRLAKNILHQVVGRYVDRDRQAMRVLADLQNLPYFVAEAMARKDLAGFGRMIDVAWRLNKKIDPDSSNAAIEAVLDSIKTHIYGAKLLGAGGGGFLLIVARSPADAAAIREVLSTRPPNPRARFFDFNVSPDGLVVTAC